MNTQLIDLKIWAVLN